MGEESDDLDRIFEAIADGEPVDWDALERAAPDDEARAVVRRLRLIAEVSEVHRSQVDNIPTPDAETVPAVWPAAVWHQAPTSPQTTLDSLKPGQVWGHLLLVRKIGEGSYGEVYQAHDTWLDHSVALKLLKTEAERRVQPSDLLHEARRLARVRHTNVVTVHGADRHHGRVGFWMDFIDGETLSVRVAKGRMSAGEATSVGEEVCRALAAVHRASIIHRDVKAQNVMRAHDGGRIILMDFGAGQFLDDSSPGRRAQGTPLYLAPEVLRGENATIRSDIYAVGVLLYHLVTGRFPVERGSPPELIDAHERGARRRLRDERPDLPETFIAVVERAIDLDPGRRYGSAGEMEAKLSGEPSTRPEPVHVRPPQPPPPGPGLVKRAAALGAGILVLTGALGLIAARTFEVALHVDPDFSLGLRDVFAVGFQGLLPFIVWWTACGAVTGVIFGIRALLPEPLLRRLRQFVSPLDSLNPAVLGTMFFVAAATLSVALTWRYAPVFAALLALWQNPQVSADALLVLDVSSRPIHEDHGVFSAVLSFLLGMAVWRWFPKLEKRADDASSLRAMKWATLAIALLIVALAVAPRRICWERFTVASFGNRPVLVIGTSGGEYLLYAPSEATRLRFRVPRDAPSLVVSGETLPLFDRNR